MSKPIKNYTLDCEFITPCWMAGADQGRAEIREPSIRGELRWWFRILGGSAAAEKQVFGGVHDGAVSSAVVVRVRNAEIRPANDLPRLGQNDPLGYMWYFVVAGENEKQRYTDKGCLDAGTSFRVQVLLRRPLPAPLLTLTEDALTAFATFGSLGLRANRAAGAFRASSADLAIPGDLQQITSWLSPRQGVTGYVVADDQGQPRACNSWHDVCALFQNLLRHGLRADHKAGRNNDRPSPLGRAVPRRQASAVHLRPVRCGDAYFAVALYAPGVLDRENAIAGYDPGGTRFTHPERAGRTHKLLPLNGIL